MKRAPFVLLGGILICGGCTSIPRRAAKDPLPEQGPVVFVANGAGDFRAASASLRMVLAREHLPIRVETVAWSHGYLRILRDQLDYPHGRSEGTRLAADLLAYKKAHPGVNIYLLGHSAGAVVVLTAAEAMPPGSIEGMALLSPSVSAGYDLRPALRAVRGHVDVYYSQRDWLYLGLGTGIFGTSDRVHAPPSGRIGFQPHADSPEERAEFAKLRQHAWRLADWPLHNGGHYGAYQPRYLRSQVLPWLFEKEMHETSQSLNGR